MTADSAVVLLSQSWTIQLFHRILSAASWPTYQFLRRQVMVWYSHLFKSFPQFIMIHTVYHQFISVIQLCQTLWDPMDCSMPGFHVHHQFPGLAQTHVQWVGDAIQPSHPLSSRSSAFNLSQHQGLFKSVSSLHQVAKVLEFHLHPSVFPTNIQGWFPLGLTGWITSQSKRLKSLLQQRSSKASILPCSAFFIVQLLHDCWKNHSFD